MNLPTVGFVGQPYWTRRLCDLLQLYASDRISAVSVGVPDDGLSRLFARCRSVDLLVRVGMRPGAWTRRGMAFDCIWSLLRTANRRSRCAYYWIGTDVLNAVQSAATRHQTPFFHGALRDRHIAGAPWLSEELRGIGVPADTVLFPIHLPDIDGIAPLPAQFTVLSYVPDDRHQFYGGEFIYKAAQDLPDVQFEIIGGKGAWITHPLPNLRFYGWVDDVRPFYARASLLLRYVPHDALGGTIRDALVFARPAIFTYPVPFTRQVAYGEYELLREAISEQHQLHLGGRLALNLEGREFALRQWNTHRLASDLASTLGAMAH